MGAYVDSVEFITHTCGNCNMPFAMTRDFYDRRKADHKTWYCPAGCPPRVHREVRGGETAGCRHESHPHDGAASAPLRMGRKLQNDAKTNAVTYGVADRACCCENHTGDTHG